MSTSVSFKQARPWKNHLERLRSATLNKYSYRDLPRFITEKTYIMGRPYNFAEHEYQLFILSQEAAVKNVRKCSQVGLSEISARGALALCATIPHFTIAYTLPTASFASTFMKTRIDPVIADSPYLKDMLSKGNDNNEVKQLGSSFIYLKGAQSSNAPISVPCDALIHDEVDFSDPEVLSQYRSRLTHSKYRWVQRLSTPTLPGRGIDAEFQVSRRYFNLCKCTHCSKWFLPDYYKNVVIPGFLGDIKEITKANLHKVRYQDAYVACPHCGQKADLGPGNREYVLENTEEHHDAVGIQVQPFDAPTIVTPGYLIKASTEYKRRVDFDNFALGLPSMDEESAFSREELNNLLVQSLPEGISGYVMGVDFGMTVHFTVLGVHWSGSVVRVHIEQCPLSEFRTRYWELRAKFKVRVTVADAMPYTETVMNLQERDTNLFASYYVRMKQAKTYSLINEENEGPTEERSLRQVNINRNLAFDRLMDLIREGRFKALYSEHHDVWVDQMTDMCRIREFDASNKEAMFVWQKSAAGNDHWHHATLYAWVAAQIMPTLSGGTLGGPLLTTFKAGKF